MSDDWSEFKRAIGKWLLAKEAWAGVLLNVTTRWFV
jgi:hypothetical protein